MTELVLMNILEKFRIAIKGTIFENKVYIVGGAVRDYIMRRKINDIDLVINLPFGGVGFAEWITRRFGVYKKGSNPIIYGRFGTAQFRLDDIEFEAVMTRQESYDPGSRKPVVKFGTIEQDVFRRDFTINSLILNISDNSLQDLTGRGIIDLEEGVINTTSDANSIFKEDPLRMLRAARFASQLDGSVDKKFKIGKDTLMGMLNNSNEIKNISKERIRDELIKIMLSPNPIIGIDLLYYTDLMRFIIREFECIVGLEQNKYHKYDVYGHTLLTITKTPEVLTVRLGALFHDIGKQKIITKNEEGTNSFYGHEIESAKIAERVLTDLKFAKDTIRSVVKIIELHMITKNWGPKAERVSDKSLRKLIRRAGSDLSDLLLLIHADNCSHANEYNMPDQVREIKNRLDNLRERKEPEKMSINGNDIMTFFRVKSGKRVGKLLKIAEDIFLDNPKISRNDLLLKVQEKVKDKNNEKST
jgi:putative nucleotidyltransferase with HDIG domain